MRSSHEIKSLVSSSTILIDCSGQNLLIENEMQFALSLFALYFFLFTIRADGPDSFGNQTCELTDGLKKVLENLLNVTENVNGKSNLITRTFF